MNKKSKYVQSKVTNITEIRRHLTRFGKCQTADDQKRYYFEVHDHSENLRDNTRFDNGGIINDFIVNRSKTKKMHVNFSFVLQTLLLSARVLLCHSMS